MYFQLRSLQDDHARLFYSADVIQEGCNIFIIIKELPQHEAPYKFVNTSPKIKINVPTIQESLEDGKVVYYGWDEPCKGDK